MRATPYKVQFKTATGRGWIDGYTKAAAAKAEADRVNASTQKTGMTAVYLGHEMAAHRRAKEADQRDLNPGEFEARF
jgi:hypothetical protein